MKTFFEKSNFKMGFYFLCFFIMCICDQQIGSAAGEMQLVCPNIVFCVLSGMVLSHYPLSSYRRPLFWILFLPCVVGAGIVFWLKLPGTYYFWQLTSGTIAAVLYCCVIIQTSFAIYARKGIPEGRGVGMGLLLPLFFLMLFSRYDDYNGVLLCLSVLLIYFTDYTAGEWEGMIKALGSAIIAGFFVLQGLAFVFRPYDTLRYLGMYANTNMNALLYQMTYCVFLSYFCRMEGKKIHPFWRWLSFCFACAMWGFVLLTMCRSAMLGMAVATLLGFGLLLWNQKKRFWKGILYVGSLGLGIVLAFPLVYGAVRYLPPVFHHPIWFMDEYSEDKVHSWDPYDSEKYIDWRDVLEENFGRLFVNLTPFQVKLDTGVSLAKEGWEPIVAVGRPSILLCSGEENAGKEPEAIPEEEINEPARGNSAVARFQIYRHYLSKLNLMGHKESENGLQITKRFYATHAHNLILQYGFNYGVLAGLILLIYLMVSGIRLLMLCLRDPMGMSSELLVLLLLGSIAVFGMLEVIWRNGQLSHTLVLLLPCFAWRQNKAKGAQRQPSPVDCG